MSYHILLASIGGILPALFWLWFWLQEDRLHPEPKRIIAYSFLGGMASVAVAVVVEQYIQDLALTKDLTTILWAATEEICKFGAAYVIAFHGVYFDEPIDAIMYLISAALGFAALENTFFIFKELVTNDFLASLATSNLRFIGATLLHVLASGTAGVLMALVFYKKSRFLHYLFGIIGIGIGITLHALFNLFILNDPKSEHLFSIFGFVWICLLILLVIFEKIKRLKKPRAIHR